MLPPDVEDRVAAIAADQSSGANELALRALEAFTAFCTTRRTAEELNGLAERIAAAQPSMAVVRNAARAVAHLLIEVPDEPELAIREVRRVLVGAHEKIARNSLKVFSQRTAILTLSRSAAVLAVCRMLRERGRLAAVYVLESVPGREGRTAAKELEAAGIAAKVVEDAVGRDLVGDCDAVVTGADSVLRDGALVNKVGTYALAHAAREAGTSFHGACEVLKIDALHDTATFPSSAALRPEESGAAVGTAPSDVLFDLTPPPLVTSYITDRGIYEPKRIGRLSAF